MAHFDTSALESWSVVTGICMIITGLVYRKVSKNKKDESHTP